MTVVLSEVVAPAVDGDDDLSLLPAESTELTEELADPWTTPSPTRRLVQELPEIRRRLATWARAQVAAAREAAAWMTGGVKPAGEAATTWRRRVRYQPRHGVERRWFGRERSTAEVTGAYHRNYRQGADLMEVDLPVPVYWVGWAYRIMEVLRAEDEALHPSTGHRFVCS